MTDKPDFVTMILLSGREADAATKGLTDWSAEARKGAMICRDIRLWKDGRIKIVNNKLVRKEKD